MPRVKPKHVSRPIFDEAHAIAPVFGEPHPSPDPTRFNVPHNTAQDNKFYKEIQNLLTKDVVSFDKMLGNPGDLYSLETAYGPSGANIVSQIEKAGQITFHAVGDTGASSDARGKYKNEITVADQVSQDCQQSPPTTRPSFLFHLGDVVYNFCESQYWYDQFYEPYRNYPAPIFAIPGNHDSFIVPGTAAAEDPLVTFSRNFCAQQPTVTKEAASLHRTAMTQPGVYFTLDAPFVRIIGLFSNSLEDPGVISNESGQWSAVPAYQLDYLSAQLQNIKKEKYTGAVILAVHHPPFCYAPPPNSPGAAGNHTSSLQMLGEIDSVCKEEGVYPHAFLSGHAHNYQRYTRSITFNGQSYDVPFVVCGDGGHNVNALSQSSAGKPSVEPQFGVDVTYLDKSGSIASNSLSLKKYADSNTSYGYLRITVTPQSLAIGFHLAGSSLAQSQFDLVTVDIASHQAVAN